MDMKKKKNLKNGIIFFKNILPKKRANIVSCQKNIESKISQLGNFLMANGNNTTNLTTRF